jgi:membrane associated rhomboid family serine protease
MSLWNDIFRRLTIPALLTLFIAVFSVLVVQLDIDPERFAIHPRDSGHWLGIFTVPLVHGSWSHLINNLLGFAGLSSLLFVIYPRISKTVMVLLWVLTGAGMYLFARSEYFHIGASGVVYALIFFLLAAGLFVARRTPLAISILVGLYYGSSFWGIFPLEEGVSWDGHLAGAATGILVAWIFRRSVSAEYPEEKKPSWYQEESDEDEYKHFGDQN